MFVGVVVQERQRFLRDGVAMLLGAEDDLDVVGTAVDGAGLLRVCQQRRPAVAVFEFRAEGRDGARLVAELRTCDPQLRLVGLAGDVEPGLDHAARRAGLDAVVTLADGAHELLAAVRGAERTTAPTALFADRAAADGRAAALTSRERAVLGMVSAGATTKEVAHRLGISPKTVENHKQRIFAKLGVHNQAHAVSTALRSGLLGGAPTTRSAEA